MSGISSYHAGLAAEDIVSRAYQSLGWQELKRRWRGPGGEIDLIMAAGETTVFVEVKKSRDFASAAARITARQLGRIEASAMGYIAQLENGQNSETRIDAALVDAQGRVEILENVTLH